MIEKTFIAPLNQKNNLKELKKHLLRALGENNGIMTEMDNGKEYSLLVAYPNSHKDVFDKIIRMELTRYFSYYFKIDFFRNQLMLEKVNPILAETFIRALSRFDQSLDLNDITLALEDYNTINLQSFFYFRLTSMKKRWEELITLTNENSIWLLSEQSFEDLLKFLITNLESQIDYVYIDVNDKMTKIYDKNKNLIAQKKIKAEYCQLWLLMALIKYAPKKITIIKNSNNAKFNLLDKFFASKIDYKISSV